MTSVSTDRRQGVNSGAAIKVPCKAASTANLTLSGEQTVDGVALVTGDRCLVKNQTTGTENGIYTVDTGTWNRSDDFDGYYDALTGTLVSVIPGGTVNGSTMWRITTTGTITIGTTSLAFGAAVFSDSDDVYFLQSGTGAVSRTVQSKLREIKSITDYGADTGNTAAVNTPLIQAAIDANYNKALRVPAGTFLVATTGQTDSSVAAVGAALNITDEITIIFEGIIKGNNNCAVFAIAAGSADVVKFESEGGGIQGFGSFITAGAGPLSDLSNKGGTLWQVTGGIFRCVGLRLIDPPQYCGWAQGPDEGEVSECEFIGGPLTYTGDNHFGICLFDASTGWKLTGNKTLKNGTGQVVQAVGSVTLTTGTADRSMVNGNRFFNQWEKGVYLFGADCQINDNWVYDNANGEGIRIIGARPQVNSNLIRNCLGGGITLYDAGGAVCSANELSGIRGSGITLAYYDDGTIGSATLDHAKIQGNEIHMDTGVSTGGRGIDIRIGMNTGSVASDENGIQVLDNTVTGANYNSADPLAAIDFLAFNAASIFRDLRVERNYVVDCGAVGIRFGAAVYNYFNLVGNKVRDCAQSIARSAYVWDNGVAITGQKICENEARKETGANAMTYGFENVTAAGITSTDVSDNHVRTAGTAPYLNLTGTTNSRSRNRNGDSALQGSFTCTAGATTVVSNSNAQAGMRIALYPTNAAAAALQGTAAGALFFGGTISAGVSFTLVSTGGAAAGTETFDYAIDV